MPPLPSLALEARAGPAFQELPKCIRLPSPIRASRSGGPGADGRQRPASLAPIYAALAVLVALGLLALVVAFWPPGAGRPSAFQHPRLRAPAEHPAGNGLEAPPRTAVPKRGVIWTQASVAQGFATLG